MSNHKNIINTQTWLKFTEMAESNDTIISTNKNTKSLKNFTFHFFLRAELVVRNISTFNLF